MNTAKEKAMICIARKGRILEEINAMGTDQRGGINGLRARVQSLQGNHVENREIMTIVTIIGRGIY